MKDLTISNALREQYRDPEAYLEQVGNVLFGLFRLLGWWIAITVTYTSGFAILAFITSDLSAYSQDQLQDYARFVATFAGAAAAVACLLGNIGKFRDVFSARATDKVLRYEAIKEGFLSQTDTTEGLLVAHGLISEADVERRRADPDPLAHTLRPSSKSL